MKCGLFGFAFRMLFSACLPLYFGSSDSTNLTAGATTDDHSLWTEEGNVSQISSGSGAISILDGGAVRGAFDLVAANDVQMGKNYDSLLTTTGEGFDNLVSASSKDYGSLLSATSDLFGQSADQYSGLLSATSKGFDNLLSASGDVADIGRSNYKDMLSTTTDLFGQVFDQGGTNYEKLLSNTSTTMAGLMDSIGATQNWIQGSLDTAQSKGTLDNRTITVIGVALAAVLGLFLLRGKRA